MASRGEYTAIHTALVDDPDFKALSAEARLAFFTLKLILGPSGIDVVRLFVLQMELTDNKWLCQQDDVVWLRNGWRHNPNLSETNDKHVKSVRNHIAGLPRLPIVNAFALYYELPVPFEGIPSEWVAVPYAMQVHGKGRGSGNSSVLSERGDERPTGEQAEGPVDFNAAVAVSVREHHWLGNTPPRMQGEADWGMGNEITIAHQWAKEFEDQDLVLAVIPLLREVAGVPPEVPTSLRMFHHRTKRHHLQHAVGAVRKRREQAASSATVAQLLRAS
jgi:hypothetical protein